MTTGDVASRFKAGLREGFDHVVPKLAERGLAREQLGDDWEAKSLSFLITAGTTLSAEDALAYAEEATREARERWLWPFELVAHRLNIELGAREYSIRCKVWVPPGRGGG